jgi:hypothetical protein
VSPWTGLLLVHLVLDVGVVVGIRRKLSQFTRAWAAYQRVLVEAMRQRDEAQAEIERLTDELLGRDDVPI